MPRYITICQQKETSPEPHNPESKKARPGANATVNSGLLIRYSVQAKDFGNEKSCKTSIRSSVQDFKKHLKSGPCGFFPGKFPGLYSSPSAKLGPCWAACGKFIEEMAKLSPVPGIIEIKGGFPCHLRQARLPGSNHRATAGHGLENR